MIYDNVDKSYNELIRLYNDLILKKEELTDKDPSDILSKILEHDNWIKYGFGVDMYDILSNDTMSIDEVLYLLHYMIKQSSTNYYNSEISIRNYSHIGPYFVSIFMNGLNIAMRNMKKAGVKGTLYDNIKYIDLVLYNDLQESTGLANINDKTIAISVNNVIEFDTDKLPYVIVHEIGHILQSVIHGLASEYWDEQWEDIENKFSIDERQLNEYWEMLKKDEFYPMQIIKKLKGTDRLKFRIFIINLGCYDHNGHKISDCGAFDKVRNPAKFCRNSNNIPECYKNIENMEDMIKLDFMVSGEMGIQSEYASINDAPDWFRDEYSKIYKEYGFPTYYAMKNSFEDFAETFTAFVMNPGELSENAKFRIKRALWLDNKKNVKVSSWYF